LPDRPAPEKNPSHHGTPDPRHVLERNLNDHNLRDQQPTKRPDDTRIGGQHPGLGQPIKITKLALIATATVAATIALRATAHADASGQFASPSGNIHCVFGSSPAPLAMCSIRDHTFAEPQASPCDGGPTPTEQFELDQGKPGIPRCDYSALASGFGPWPSLAYGQTRSIGTITCDSETSGVTCTDSSTGHFFRVSRDSYQLG
jgi:hypothetical protein